MPEGKQPPDRAPQLTSEAVAGLRGSLSPRSPVSTQEGKKITLVLANSDVEGVSQKGEWSLFFKILYCQHCKIIQLTHTE